MKIGIIGAGNIGSALATVLVPLGHEVVISNSRGPQTLTEVAQQTGATAVTAAQAAQGRDLVVVTIQQFRVPELVEADLFNGVPDDVVVIETNNYYPQQRDGRIDAIENGTTESRWVADQIGRPRLVKAFNNIYSEYIKTHGKPAGDPARIALPYAGDDERANRVAAELLDSIGFDPVLSGGLDESWRHQPGTPAYGTDLTADKLREALAEATPERPSDFSVAA
jgi:8-hydroxy-5-deazaflavin:NADPH oxidoreductase